MNLFKSINRSFLQCAFFIILVALACFAFSPTAQATPDPERVSGVFNTADGFNAMPRMSAGTANSAFGTFALFSAVSSNANTAVGAAALFENTSGSNNTATGFLALFSNTTGFENTAIGRDALSHNTVGNDNTAIGVGALGGGNTGSNNIGFGQGALYGNGGTGGGNTGNNNIGIGNGALGGGNTGFFNSGNNNIGFGNGAGQYLTTGNDNIDIGNPGVADEANTIRIDTPLNPDTGEGQNRAFIAGISGQDATGGDPVFITSDGKLGTLNPPSSARFKEEIKPMNQASEVILALKPVTFRYKKEFDSTRIPQFGLVAEEVERVNPDLVKRDREGKVQTVRYDAVNAMLLNEFLKEHRSVQDQGATIAELKREIANLRTTVKEQATQIRKVSARIEMNEGVSQTVAKR